MLDQTQTHMKQKHINIHTAFLKCSEKWRINI